MPQAMTVRDKVRARVRSGARDRFWTAAVLQAVGDPTSVDRALAQLERDGELRRVRRGLYWRGRQTLFGMSGPPSADLVSAVISMKGVGPAGLSAANDLGLSTQVPAVDIVAVPRRAPRPVPRVRFVDRAARSGRVTAALGPTEVALLEVLWDWDGLVELDDDTAHQRVVDLVRSGAVSVSKLVRAAPKEPAAVRGRLRGILDAAGEHEAAARVPPPRSQTVSLGHIW